MALSIPPRTDRRSTCYTCFKPASHCYCAGLPRIDNRTKVVLLQHPREHGHALGTARLANLALTNSELHVDYNRRFTGERLQLPPRTGVLYPGPEAQPLEALAPEQRPEALVVLDGTWHHAHCLYRDIPWLREYPTYRLSPSSPSRYRIRREPAAHCISTVESVVDALRVLEPDLSGVDELLHVFDRIIDRQIASQAQRRGESRYRRRGKTRSLPAALTEQPEKLVVLYSESRATRGKACPAAASRQILYWIAYRPHSGETFAAFRAPEPHERQPSTELLQHMGLGREHLGSGLSEESLSRAWQAFCVPTDILLAWNRSTLESLAQLGVSNAQQRSALELRHIYLNLQRHRGCLDSILQLEQLEAASRTLAEKLAQRRATPASDPIRGRALERLANAATILSWLQAQASIAQATPRR